MPAFLKFVLSWVGGIARDGVPRESGEERTRALLALSQPRITGAGSNRVFSNPWPEWQVCARTKSVITVRKSDCNCCSNNKPLPLSAGPNIREPAQVRLGTSIPQHCHWVTSRSPKPHSCRPCKSLPPCTPKLHTALANPAGERFSTAAVDQPAHTFTSCQQQLLILRRSLLKQVTPTLQDNTCWH